MALTKNLETVTERILQYLALTHILFIFFLGPILSIALTIYILFFTRYYMLMLAYIVWIYIDRNTCHQDGRRLNCLRNTGLWRYYRDYFPQNLVKTADLPPSSNYILCFFPHGVACSAAFALFAWDNSDFPLQFPGIRITGHTLNINFYIPFTREYALGLGLRSVSKEAILHQLKKPGGHAVNLCVGGSSEAMISSPGTYRVVLKNRKGFIKLALNTGSALVPMYVFGEVDIYQQHIYPTSSLKRKAQEMFRRLTGVAPCVFQGRGLFGLLPFRVAVTTVVGKPIFVEKTEAPTDQQVNDLHQQFIRELTSLFEEHKHKYIPNSQSIHLSIEG